MPGRVGLDEVVAELALEDAVHAADLLLLTKLDAVVADTCAGARRAGPAASGAARRGNSLVKNGTLQKELCFPRAGTRKQACDIVQGHRRA